MASRRFSVALSRLCEVAVIIALAAIPEPVPGSGRGTVDTVRTEAAKETVAPRGNFVEVDTQPMVGLNPSALAPYREESEVVDQWWAGKATADYRAVDGQIATSGTAARREDAGQWGHGSMPYSSSLGGEWHENSRFGLTRFVAWKTDIQEGARRPMMSEVRDTGPTIAATRALAEESAISRAFASNGWW